MSNIKQLLSYSTILNDMSKFKKTTGDMLDIPGTFFFKVIFYFNNPGENDGYTSNLLGWDMNGTVDGGTMPIDSPGSSISINESPSYTLSKERKGDANNNVGAQFGSQPAATSMNTAYNYLCMNAEYERAQNLKDFIFMLSEISSNEPWYFKSIEGLDAVMDRTWIKEGMKLEDKTGSINIKCLRDSVDSRIMTMLQLYQSACWSQTWRREIVPSNLRKFDMGIYIFQAPTKGSSYNTINKDIKGIDNNPMNADVYAGCHYFEFHDCEIDPSSFKSGFGEMNNETGFGMEPTISIMYNDCFVSGYNDQLCRSIGDLVKSDLDSRFVLDSYDSITGEKDNSAWKREEERASEYKSNKLAEKSAMTAFNKSNKSRTFSELAVDNAIGVAKNTAKKIVRKAYLGNVYGASLADIVGNAQQIASGDVIGGTLRAAKTTVPKTVESIKDKSVISDTLPSLIGKRDVNNIKLGNVYKNIVRNL